MPQIWYKICDYKGDRKQGQMISADSLDSAAKKLIEKYDVKVMPSGNVYLAENGKQIQVYLFVDPTGSDKAKEAIKAENLRIANLASIEKEKENLLDDLINSIGIDQAIAKLQDK